MNIFLVGSTSFIGQHLKSNLDKLGHNVFCYTQDTALIPELIDEEYPKPDCIINAEEEAIQVHKMFESNVVLTEKLLKFAYYANIPKFIQIGSFLEYGDIKWPRKESAMCSPTDYYGATKLAATNLALGYANQYDMNVCVVRPFSLYGANDYSHNIIPCLINAHKNRERIRLNEIQQDWTYIKDFVNGIITILESPTEKTKGDIVNFGTGISSSNSQVADLLARALGGYVPYSITEGEILNKCVADNTKAQIKYGWYPKFNLDDGIQDMLTYMKR